MDNETELLSEPVSPLRLEPEIKKEKRINIMGVMVTILIMIVAGIGTGYGLRTILKGNEGNTSNKEIIGAPGTVSAEEIAVGKTYGLVDEAKFPDISEGVVNKGGVDGEGSHHLVRPGGKSQTVYLTSSTVDLDLFEGHKVIVKGETFSAQKAAWFMDVGSVKVVELNVKVEEPETETTNKKTTVNSEP